MTPMLDFYLTAPGIVFLTAALILVIVQMAVLLHSVRDKCNKVSLCISAVHFLIVFAVFVLMLYAEDVYDNLEEGAVLPANNPAAIIFSVPWVIYIALEIFAALVICWQIRRHLKYAKTHLTPGTVKDTLDWLPVGVCIGDTDGNILLSNLKMNALSQSLTNRYLTDANYLWEEITKKGMAQEDGVLCEDLDGKAWLYTKKPMMLHEREHERKLEQIFAMDMTDTYRIMQELSANNKHLKDVQYRMKAVAARERSLVAAREVVKARTAVHNQMGGVLLAGRCFMEHPDNTDQAELLHLLEYNNYFLLGEVKQQEQQTDKLNAALKMAKRIGVTVEIEGVLPEQKSVRNVLAEAVEQCAANTVRHADGDCLTVTVTESDEQYTAVFTNNGKPPEQKITETGGLTYLRRAAESAGGTMTVESIPVFRLTVTVPKA